MAIIGFSEKSYKKLKSIHNVIQYSTYKYGTKLNVVGGIGVDYSSLETMIEQFIIVKQAFHKYEPGHRQVIQFILSFTQDEKLTYSQIDRIAYLVANYYGISYQIVYGLHEDT